MEKLIRINTTKGNVLAVVNDHYIMKVITPTSNVYITPYLNYHGMKFKIMCEAENIQEELPEYFLWENLK